MRTLGHLCILAALCFVLFFLGLGQKSLVSSHEPRAGQIAYMMAGEGRWLIPTLIHDTPTYEKPPLYYWCAAASMKAFGVNPFAVRFPAAAAATIMVILCYFFFGYELGASGGFVAAAALSASVKFLALARTARIDMLLACAVTAALFFFYCGFVGRMRPVRAIIACALATAAGVLAKGPVAAVFVGIAALGFVALSRSVGGYRGRVAPCILTGAVVFLAVAAPWYVVAHRVTEGAFTQTFFVAHNLRRAGIGGYAYKEHFHWLVYVPYLAWGFFPWSFFAAGGMVEACRRREAPIPRIVVLGAAWAVALFVLLCVVRFRRHDYILPILPALSIFVGVLWTRARPGAMTMKVSAAAFGVLIAVVVAAALVGYVGHVSGLAQRLAPDRFLNDGDGLGRASWVLPANMWEAFIAGAVGAAAIGVGVFSACRGARRPAMLFESVVSLFVAGALFYVAWVVPKLERELARSDVAARVIRDTGALPLLFFEYERHEIAWRAIALRSGGGKVLYAASAADAAHIEEATGGEFMILTDRTHLRHVPLRWRQTPAYRGEPYARGEKPHRDIFFWHVDLSQVPRTHLAWRRTIIESRRAAK